MTLVLALTSIMPRPEPGPLSLNRVQEARARLANMEITLDTGYIMRNLDDPGFWETAVPGRFIIKHAPGADPQAILMSLSEFQPILVKKSRTGADFVVIETRALSPEDGARFIRAARDAEGVLWAEPDRLLHAFMTPNDPYWADQWGPYIMYMDLAWDISTGNSDVLVGVVDEGCDYNHPDLAGNFGSTKGYDFVDNDSDPYPDDPVNEFHGTHVSGTVAGVLNNDTGVAGMANITLLSVRCLDETGSGYLEDIADGIRWAADQGVKVISMSLGGGTGSTVLQEAVNYAYDTAGVLLIAASGNDGLATVSYPAAYSACVAVGALDTSGSLAYFSNFGYSQEVVAPGVGIVSTIPNNGYDYYDGTSMATPHVSGLAALLFSVDTSLSHEDVRGILQGTAIDMGGDGWDMTYGYGLVDGYAAAQIAQSMSPAERLSERIYLRQNPARGTAAFLVPFPDPGSALRIYDSAGRLVANLPVSGTEVFWTPPTPGTYVATLPGRHVVFVVK